MKELEKAIEQLEKENTKIEKAQNRAKLLNQKINKLKRSAETKRKIEKGRKEGCTSSRYVFRKIYCWKQYNGPCDYEKQQRTCR